MKPVTACPHAIGVNTIRTTALRTTARIAFSGRDLIRAVEPGTLNLWVGGSCAESDVTASVELIGRRHEISPADTRWVDVVVEPVH